MDGIFSISNSYINEFSQGPLAFIASLATIIPVAINIMKYTFIFLRKKELMRRENSINPIYFWIFSVREIKNKYIKSNKTSGIPSAILILILSVPMIYFLHMITSVYYTPNNSALLVFKKSDVFFALSPDKVQSSRVINPMASDWSINFSECNNSGEVELSKKHKLTKTLIKDICSIQSSNNYKDEVKNEIEKFKKDKITIYFLLVMLTLYIIYLQLSLLVHHLFRKKTIQERIKKRARTFIDKYNLNKSNQKELNKQKHELDNKQKKEREENERVRKEDIAKLEKDLGIIYHNKRN
ncbi:DUF6216 family protein [Tatumella sp. OPLPL6]|uniref:DUF6216 family protein n=1 Tax=Tatumella sp. OPLPL6 TaxID=1928657 RepID=UPI000C18C112|nr:DUF6216 family protein [Tatumella sp. OPLPL6]PIJ42627.1 hypothetical protein BOM24_12345 [Tatumella sp. OPLPL6]